MSAWAPWCDQLGNEFLDSFAREVFGGKPLLYADLGPVDGGGRVHIKGIAADGEPVDVKLTIIRGDDTPAWLDIGEE